MFRKNNLFKINNINFVLLFINKYIIVDFNVIEKIDNKLIKVCFIKYLYIIDKLKTNILINNNILKFKKNIKY